MPKGLKPVRRKLADGNVKLYWYHRATGQALKHDPQSTEGLLEVQRLDAKAAKAALAVDSAAAGTLAALWLAYRGDPLRPDQFPSSPEWLNLKPRTRSDYQKVRDWLGKAADTATVATITSSAVIELRDKAARQKGRRFANYVVAVLRLLLAWGKLRGWLGQQANPADGVPQVKKPKGEKNLNRPWAQHEVLAFVDGAPFQLLVPFCLGLFAGMRQGDALKVTRKAYNGLTVRWIAGKNDERCTAPVGGAFKAVLDRAIAEAGDCVQLAVNSRGDAWTESGFRASFFKRVRALTEAGKLEPGCTFHGLRHTIGTFARDGGESSFRIAAAIGDRSLAMADIYGRDADREAAQVGVLADVQKRFANIEWKTGLENVPSTRKARKAKT